MHALLLGRHPRRTVARVATLVGAVVIALGYVLIPVRGQGPSMSPTVEDGDLVFVNRLAYASSPPSRGDIVALRLAGPRVVYVKRIVALPGERVRLEAGTVHVDDVPLEEPYVHRRRAWTTPEVALERDEYLVIGDNRAMAVEHDFGTVRRHRILGRVLRLP